MNTRFEEFILWVLNIPFVLLIILMADGCIYAYAFLENLFFGTVIPLLWVSMGMFLMSAVTGIQFVLCSMSDKLKTRSKLMKLHKLGNSSQDN